MFRFRFSHRPTPTFRLGAYLLTPFLLLLLMGAMFWSLAPPVVAAHDNHDDLFTDVSAPLIIPPFAGGSGTPADPYLVATAEHLNNVRDHLDAHFRQTAEIDLGVDPWNGGEGWVPMGTTLAPFTGNYDGDGYAIRNLTINRPNSSYQGLFVRISGASFLNVHLQDVDLQTKGNSGALATDIRADSRIEKITVTGAIYGGQGSYVGGLAATMSNSLLHRVAVTATVQGTSYTGGLIGSVVSGGEIRHTHSAGSVQGLDRVGGLAGYLESGIPIVSDTYSWASVSGRENVGGLIGQDFTGRIYRSYSSGPVTGTGTHVGGLLGQSGPTSFDCYWDTQRSGQLTSAGGEGVTGKTTAQMQQQATYQHYNFIALWALDEGNGYPIFQNLDRYALPQSVDLADLPGSGTLQDPYLITTIHELDAVRQDPAASYWVTNDLDLADTVVWDYGRGWTPIGESLKPFIGTFDGGGHTIRNLTINRPRTSFQGFFQKVDGAELFNIRLQDMVLQTGGNSGGLASEIRDNSILEKIEIDGSMISKEGSYVGGLVGIMQRSRLHRITVTATVQGTSYTGGLIGSIASGGEIRYTHIAGSVQGVDQVGGLVGYLGDGIPGIYDSYSRAAVHGAERVGGLIGQIKTGKVERSYSAGPVSGTGDNVGGFIGQGAGTSVSDCYWDTQTSGQLVSAGGDGVAGRSTAQMTYPHAADTYSEWNFQTIWAADVTGTHNDGYPYLDPRGADQSDVQVYILGSNRMSPGQVVDYAVNYAHYLTEPIQDALLIVRLPYLATYQASTPQGTYWPQRHELFWELGDLPAGTNARALVSVAYGWGIPRDTVDNLAAVLVGQNYQADLLDRAAYQTYTPLATTATQPLTQAQWEAEAGANPDLNTLYTQAVNDGYTWASSQRVTLNNGTIHAQATLLHLQSRAVRILQMEGGNAQAVTHTTNFYSAEDVNGGMSWDMVTNEQRYWGDWDASVGAAWPGTAISPESCEGAGCCLSNCLAKVAVNAVAGKFGTAMNAALAGYGCATAFRTQDLSAMAQCAASLGEELVSVNNVPILGELAGITECLALCAGDPNSNDCSKDLVTCEPSWANLYDWLDYPSRTIWRCKDGCFSSVPEYVPCAYGECCLPGKGCVSGDACKRSVNDPPRDPNEKYGPAGELIPGQSVDYLIEYENVGAGAAEGVYITDYLDDLFDATTLQIGPNASYYPSVRLLTWDIGHLDPAGQPGATGQVTLTVGLKDGLPGGTIVTNQATVYFPTVPEETPTGTVVNLVQPAAAIPQQLTTDYMTALAVTLSGQEVSGLPLTYAITGQPRNGTLTGTPPNITYTPAENFTGPDSFSFTVDNGTSTSRAAQVRIDVTTAGDSTPPTVVWTSPAAEAKDVVASASPVYTGTAGPVYTPVIVIGVSEALSETTVSTATVTVADGAGSPVTGTVRYDGAVNQIVFGPLVALEPGKYTVTVGTGVADVAGNPLAAAYVWTFEIKGATPPDLYLPLLMR